MRGSSRIMLWWEEYHSREEGGNVSRGGWRVRYSDGYGYYGREIFIFKYCVVEFP